MPCMYVYEADADGPPWTLEHVLCLKQKDEGTWCRYWKHLHTYV
jgi:hypothetical protein